MYTITLPGKPRLYNPTPLPGWDVVGEITRDGDLPGALVRNADTGIYAQAKAGKIRDLDQRAVAQALAATVPGVDLDGDTGLTAADAAALVGKTPQAIKYWRARGYITPLPGAGPAKYRKADVLAVASRPIKSGRPAKD
ncbi:MAG: hypothetical protein LBH65_06540 [Desulfovibrio sp.]|jgi:hypothetical protein|nr:hypothetical protein [Desulfovibrio sp.]